MSQQQAVQPIVVKQENGEVVFKLVLEMPKQQTQTVILQEPKNTNTESFWSSIDWVVICSFVITALVVWLATKCQIVSNKNFINSGRRLEHEKELRILGAQFMQTSREFKNAAEKYEKNYYKLPFDEKIKTNIQAVKALDRLQILLEKIGLTSYEISTYFSTETKIDEDILILMSFVYSLADAFIKKIAKTEYIENYSDLFTPRSYFNELEKYRGDDIKRLKKSVKFQTYDNLKNSKDIYLCIDELSVEFINQFKDILNEGKAT